MAFQRSMTTEELVKWLGGEGLHPDDCSKLKEEKFTGESFLILTKDDLKELGIGYNGRRLVEKLVEEARTQSSDPPPKAVVAASTTEVNTQIVPSGASGPVAPGDSGDDSDMTGSDDDEDPEPKGKPKSAQKGKAMAFQRSMTTEELVKWLGGKGLHPDDCSKLKEESFTGGSFLILEKDDLDVLGIGLEGRLFLEKLVEEARTQPLDPPPEAVVAASTTEVNTQIVNKTVANFDGLSSHEVLKLVDDNTILNADDDSGFVLTYLREVAGHWETISRNLHVKVSKIEELTNSRQTAPVCLGQAITDWLKLNYNHQRFGKPTWRKVAESVVKLNNSLFLRIAAEHTAPGEITVNVGEKMSALGVTKAHGTSKARGALDLDVHLGPLRVAVLQAAHKWKDIGRALPGVTEGNIQSIRFNEDSECLNAVLSKWIKTGCAKTNDLLEALEEPTVGRTDIANKIRNLKGEERAKVGLDIYSDIVLKVNTHLHHVRNALLEAASQWRDIGQALDIAPGTLNSIRGEDIQCLNEMLTKWMHGGEATMDQLLEALEDPSVQRGDIVRQIKARKGVQRSRVGLGVVAVPDSIQDQITPDPQKLFDEAMQAGYVSVKMINALLFGMAGAGKTSVKHVLFGQDPPDVRNSTPLANAPERVHIRNVTGIKVRAEGNKWTPVTTEELMQFVADTITAAGGNWEKIAEVVIHPSAGSEDADNAESEDPTSIEESKAKPEEEKDNSSSSNEAISSSKDVAPSFAQVAFADVAGKMIDCLSGKPIDTESLGRNPREIFGSNWIYFTDSAGQPHFHNLLPLFIQSISAILFVFRLSIGLDEQPLVEYYKNGKAVGVSYTSPFSNKESFKYLVRSLQSHSENGNMSKLICIGTHLDKENECKESLDDKKKALLDLLDPETRKTLEFCDENLDEIIFTFNAQCPDKHEKEMAQKLRSAVERSPPTEIKVPLWWYVLEMILESLTNQCDQKVLSKAQCLSVALFFKFDEDALTEALKFFHKHHIFHYYPEVLPDVVFCDTQVLLDKVTELVEYASFMRKPAGSLIRTTRSGKWLEFKDQGVVTLEFLSDDQFKKHFVDGLFGPNELLKIFTDLLILADLARTQDGGSYFMPALLDILPPSDLEKHRIFSPELAPLLIRFPNGWPRCGVFCCLQVYLIRDRGWMLSCLKGKPKLCTQNCVKMLYDEWLDITLIDSLSYIEVHVESCEPEEHSDICSNVMIDIQLGIAASCKVLHYDNKEPCLSFFCPCADALGSTTEHSANLPSSDLCVQQRHVGEVVGKMKRLKCIDCGNTSKLEEKHHPWLENSPVQKTYRVLTIDDNLKHVKEAVWDIRSEWNKFGEHLPGVDAGTINSIKKSEKDHGECLNEVLSKWIYKGRATINDLLKALRKTMVGRDDIADRICNLKGEKGAGVGL